ncbi:hypothetical protein KP509_19G073300 [Ceratopteris richardii]|uniref:mitogen-activated protein kinase n=1 Tax=Ceratopteris richardii TaxID=49495 RepID=A0A8T2SN70_CERRI|nr:hypothetical protein KP509_19G073300 [Ceratopteris richardii]
MGGASVDTVRNWCRNQLHKWNAPCIASDAIVSNNTISLSKSKSTRSSIQPSSFKFSLESRNTLSSDEQTDVTHVQKSTMQETKREHDVEFFTDYGDATRYKLHELIGKGSYGVVCSAIDTHTGEKVAIKKMTNIFEHVSDATRILREIKLLRLLRHPDIVELKHIMLPPSPKHFKDIYVVFELMESDLHEVIKANPDLTDEHCRFFLYQLLRALKFIHTANVFHRDLKPKNILANADCKLKICDFGLARVAFNEAPSAIFWTDYVATRWYRAPELCGSFFATYTPAVDIWSIGCIFAEVLLGKPLFPGKNVVHQLELITDLLGTPSPEVVSKIRNEKARCCLAAMPKKEPVAFSVKFPNADPAALSLLESLLAFDPNDRPTAEKALSHPYFEGITRSRCEPSAQPLSKLDFQFERNKMSKEDILEYHPEMFKTSHSGGNGSEKRTFSSTSDLVNRKILFHREKSSRTPARLSLDYEGASMSRERALGIGEVEFKVNEDLGNQSFKTLKKDGAMPVSTHPRRLFKSASVNSSYTGSVPRYGHQCTLQQGKSNTNCVNHEHEKVPKKSNAFSLHLAKTIQALRHGLTLS